MTLKVVGASPIIYHILNLLYKANQSIFFNKVSNKVTLRNPDFAAAWAYPLQSRPNFSFQAQLKKSSFVKIFTKATNFNKLFINTSTGFFLSPGIILKQYSDPTARHLKKKTKTWVYTLIALKRITKTPWIMEFHDLFGKKEFLLKRIFSQKITVNWFFLKIFYLPNTGTQKPRRRIKRWIKKKYFQLKDNTL